MEYLKTYDQAKNKKVNCGYVDGNTYHRQVKNKHYMVKEHGYGIQTDVLQKLTSIGVKSVVLHAKTTDLKSQLSTWLMRGKKKDYGHGEQVFLDTGYMENNNCKV